MGGTFFSTLYIFLKYAQLFGWLFLKIFDYNIKYLTPYVNIKLYISRT